MYPIVTISEREREASPPAPTPLHLGNKSQEKETPIQANKLCAVRLRLQFMAFNGFVQ